MSGDVEMSKCDFCHKVKPVARQYFYPSVLGRRTGTDTSLYNEGRYFIIVRYCNDCGEPTTQQLKQQSEQPKGIPTTWGKEFPSESPEQQEGWISVEEKDKLPERNDKYDVGIFQSEPCLTISKSGAMNVNVFYEDILSEPRTFEWNVDTENITHWQPLPKPPSTKQQ